MNMHLPISMQTAEELRQLAAVPTQIISPREGKPIISIVQDIVSGVYRITQEHVRFSEKQIMNLLATNPKFTGTVPAAAEAKGVVERWTGRQILSTLLPPKVNVYTRTDAYVEGTPDKEQPNAVISIKNGVIESGVLNKETFQARTKGIIHTVYNEYGADETRVLFDNVQKLMCNYLVEHGFSVGVGDMTVDGETLKKFEGIILDMKKDVYKIISDIHGGKIDNNTTKNNADYFEQKVNDILNKAINAVGKEGRKTINDTTNRLMTMIKSKAKGSDVNVAQMMGCVGQQNVEGRRIPYGFDDRTLPHYTKFDDGPAARGFVENSFIRGLTPQEYFFHAMGGREGLIDTAVQSVTGETPLIIIEDGKPRYVRIGEWIDAYLAANNTAVRHFEERRMELLDLEPGRIYIPTTDYDGNVTWGEITAMTRHDPGTELYKVNTKSGRHVIVTESKSLLVWHKDLMQFKEIPTPDIKVGDYVPVTTSLLPAAENTIKCDIDWRNLDCILNLVCFGDQQHNASLLDEFVRTSKTCIMNCESVAHAEAVAMLATRANRFTSLSGTCVTFVHSAVQQHCDVVLDEIMSIDKVSVADYPKVYDLTIPSTLNFGLANGLQVRDTSETGYIQRKLVKAMEDCKINYDMTVRNANGSIVQFLYGEDGMDACKVESQTVPSVAMDVNGVLENYGFEVDDLKAVLTPKTFESCTSKKTAAEIESAMKAHIKELVLDRDFIINTVNKGKYEDSVMYPVQISRILTITENMYKGNGVIMLSDLTPLDVLKGIETLLKECKVNNSGTGTRLFEVLVRIHLSPKKILFKHRFTKKAFDYVLKEIKKRFKNSIAHPSELVGVVAATSIGEPCTQLSCRRNERVQIYSAKNGMFDGEVGKFIDELLAKTPAKVVDLGHGSVVMDLDGPDGDDDDLRIVGVSNDEKTSWRRISQISRHPANGQLVKVTTASGRVTTCTLSHSFLKRTENGIEPVKGSDLKIGDRMPIARFIPTPTDTPNTVKIGSTDFVLSRDLGWFCGAYIADGRINPSGVISISKVIPEYQQELKRIMKLVFDRDMTQRHKDPGAPGNTLYGWDMSVYPGTENEMCHDDAAMWLMSNFGNGSFNKHIPSWVYAAPIDFVKGLIGGYVDGDGNVNSDWGKQMIRTASVSEKLTEDFILLLTRVGIYASKCVEKHIKEEERNDLHTAQISRKYARRFKENIGLVVKVKADGLDEIIKYIERDDAHSQAELIDKIPCMGDALAAIGKGLELPGQSRNFKRFQNKESIGRKTLGKIYDTFQTALAERRNEIESRYDEYRGAIEDMQTHLANSTPNNRGLIPLPENLRDYIRKLGASWVRARGLGMPTRGCQQLAHYKTLTNIAPSHLEHLINHFDAANEELYQRMHRTIVEDVEPNMTKIKSALDADVVWDEIVSLEILDDPQEMVYDFTVPGNDSFMVNCGVLVHNTLNTFHSAGISSASKSVRGVPRMIELLSYSKKIKTPVMQIYTGVFTDPTDSDQIKESKLAALKIMNNIRTIRFRDIISATSIYYDTDNFNTNIEDDMGFLRAYADFKDIYPLASSNSPWVLRMEFDKEKMTEFGLQMIHLHHALLSMYDDKVQCMFSDDNAEKLIFRVRLSTDSSAEDKLTELKALEQCILDNVEIRGIKGIERVSIHEKKSKRVDPVTRTYITDKMIKDCEGKPSCQFRMLQEWVIDTAGTNLRDVLALDFIDAKRTITNDVNEIYEVLGIEAARQALYNEIMDVLDNIVVNYRHVALLIDVMTLKGHILSVNRHGINRGDIGPLAKCSFEESTDKLIKAGVFAEYDRINGVSANIMLGQIPPCGTGDVEVLIDEEKMRGIAPKVKSAYNKGLAAIDEDPFAEDACGETNFTINYTMPAITNNIAPKVNNNMITVA